MGECLTNHGTGTRSFSSSNQFWMILIRWVEDAVESVSPGGNKFAPCNSKFIPARLQTVMTLLSARETLFIWHPRRSPPTVHRVKKMALTPLQCREPLGPRIGPIGADKALIQYLSKLYLRHWPVCRDNTARFRPSCEITLNTMDSPPGKTCGKVCPISPFSRSGIVSGSGSPPAADTCIRPL